MYIQTHTHKVHLYLYTLWFHWPLILLIRCVWRHSVCVCGFVCASEIHEWMRRIERIRRNRLQWRRDRNSAQRQRQRQRQKQQQRQRSSYASHRGVGRGEFQSKPTGQHTEETFDLRTSWKKKQMDRKVMRRGGGERTNWVSRNRWMNARCKRDDSKKKPEARRLTNAKTRQDNNNNNGNYNSGKNNNTNSCDRFE